MCECVRGREIVCMEERERYGKCVCVLPKGGLVEGSAEGTNEKRGFRDNL